MSVESQVPVGVLVVMSVDALGGGDRVLKDCLHILHGVAVIQQGRSQFLASLKDNFRSGGSDLRWSLTLLISKYSWEYWT